MTAAPFLAQLLEWGSILLVLLFLSVGSIDDYKTREVSDRIWLVSAPLGGLLTAVRLILDPSLWYLALISIVVCSVIALLLFYVGLYGGADAKALICIALTMPLFPNNLTPLIGYLHPILPLSVLYNSYLLALIPTLSLLIYNVIQFARTSGRIFEGYEHESGIRKFLTMLTGYRVSFEKLSQSIHLYPLEQPTQNREAPRKLRLFVSAESDRDKEIARLRESIPAEANVKVWATPGLPFLIFMTGGYVLVLFIGDLLMWTVFMILRTL